MVLYPAAPDPDRVKQILNQLSLRSKEPDAVNARALHALRRLNLIEDEVERLMDLFEKLQSAKIAERKEAALMLAEFGDRREVVTRLIHAASIEEDPVSCSCMVKSLSRIAIAGHHHDLLRPALVAASAYERFEARRESLGGLDALAFEGEVADRLCDLASSKRSVVVTERARKILAGKDLERVPRDLAARCRYDPQSTRRARRGNSDGRRCPLTAPGRGHDLTPWSRCSGITPNWLPSSVDRRVLAELVADEVAAGSDSPEAQDLKRRGMVPANEVSLSGSFHR